MVSYHPADVIPMNDFEFAWRIADARWSSLPDKVLKHIKPLSASKSKELLEASPCDRLSDCLFDASRYQAVRQVSLEGEGDCQVEQVRKWFGELPIASSQEIYLCWQVGDGIAAVTDWGTFTAIWTELWYPFDRMCVFDEGRQWAVVFGPEEHAVFIERRSASVATAQRAT